MLRQLQAACVLFFLLTLLTGIVYPFLMTGIADLFFPWKANGSLLTQNGQTIGSLFIGQYFKDPGYFWGRPSATKPAPYTATASSGSNLEPGNPALLKAIQWHIHTLKESDPENRQSIPIDLVTASGSGLDPHISPLSALYQIHRIAAVRGVPEAQIQRLVEKFTQERFLALFGEPRVNVLKLNMALDKISKKK
jgi:K+-transporting ATPase ATPase C chain